MIANGRRLLYFVVVMLVAAGCNSITRGSGTVISQTREVHDFTAVQFSGIGTLNVDQTGDESLTIQAEDNLLPLLKTSVVNGVLHFDNENGAGILPTKDIIYNLHVKSLTGLTFSGAGTINAAHLNADSLKVDLSGAGAITLSGTVTSQTVGISGVGSYDGTNLDSKTALINSSGAGKAIVKVSDTLTVSISGAGSVEYIGNPTVSKSITGVGSLRQRQQAQ